MKKFRKPKGDAHQVMTSLEKILCSSSSPPKQMSFLHQIGLLFVLVCIICQPVKSHDISLGITAPWKSLPDEFNQRFEILSTYTLEYFHHVQHHSIENWIRGLEQNDQFVSFLHKAHFSAVSSRSIQSVKSTLNAQLEQDCPLIFFVTDPGIAFSCQSPTSFPSQKEWLDSFSASDKPIFEMIASAQNFGFSSNGGSKQLIYVFSTFSDFESFDLLDMFHCIFFPISPPEEKQKPLYLASNFALDVKNTEYHTSTKESNHDSPEIVDHTIEYLSINDNVQIPFQTHHPMNSKLFEADDISNQIERPFPIQSLSLQASQAILDSTDPFSTLVNISSNIISLAEGLSSYPISPDSHQKFQVPGLHPGGTQVLLNGKRIVQSSLDHGLGVDFYSLVDTMVSEHKFLSQIGAIINDFKTKESYINPLQLIKNFPSFSNEFNFRIDYTSPAIIWLYDPETDPRLEGYQDSYAACAPKQQFYYGQFSPQPCRKKFVNLVFYLDPSYQPDRKALRSLARMVQQSPQIGLAVGIVLYDQKTLFFDPIDHTRWVLEPSVLDQHDDVWLAYTRLVYQICQDKELLGQVLSGSSRVNSKDDLQHLTLSINRPDLFSDLFSFLDPDTSSPNMLNVQSVYKHMRYHNILPRPTPIWINGYLIYNQLPPNLPHYVEQLFSFIFRNSFSILETLDNSISFLDYLFSFTNTIDQHVEFISNNKLVFEQPIESPIRITCGTLNTPDLEFHHTISADFATPVGVFMLRQVFLYCDSVDDSNLHSFSFVQKNHFHQGIDVFLSSLEFHLSNGANFRDFISLFDYLLKHPNVIHSIDSVEKVLRLFSITPSTIIHHIPIDNEKTGFATWNLNGRLLILDMPDIVQFATPSVFSSNEKYMQPFAKYLLQNGVSPLSFVKVNTFISQYLLEDAAISPSTAHQYQGRINFEQLGLSPHITLGNKFNKENNGASYKEPLFSIIAIVDPLSKESQHVIPWLDIFNQYPGIADIQIYLNPSLRVNRLINTYTRFSFDGLVSFSPRIVNPYATYVARVESHDSWFTQISKADFDLDNIDLKENGDAKQSEQHERIALFSLTDLVFSGSANDYTNLPPTPARGARLSLSSTHQDNQTISDTLVMANFGYWQLWAPSPGLFQIQLSDKESQILYSLDQTVFAALSFSSRSLPLVLHKNPGHLETSLNQLYKLSADSNKQGIFDLASMYFFSTEDVVSDDTIHIFSLATGRLYENFLQRMISSVIYHGFDAKTHQPRKFHFWLLGQFLSPRFKSDILIDAEKHNYQVTFVDYKWPQWLRKPSDRQRTIWAYKILFLDVLFPQSVEKIIFLDADSIVRTDLQELIDWNMEGAILSYTPFCDNKPEMDGYRFWKKGFWNSHLRGSPYFISAMYLVDLHKFRRTASGDQFRVLYEQLSSGENNLANLDQDLPNFAQISLPIQMLPQEWLWCETWCSSDSLQNAKVIDACNNPHTKEPKMHIVDRIAKRLAYYEILEKSGRQIDEDKIDISLFPWFARPQDN